MAKADNKENITWISNEVSRGAFITVDKQKRLFVSTEARQLMNVPDGYFELIIGYDAVNKRIVAAKPDVVRVPDVKPFKFDKRAYAKSLKFVQNTKLSEDDLPIRFNYIGKDYASYKGAHAFQLEDYEAPDA
ncbi:hypothetical protein [Oceanobacillus neutriphilus]|uniref:Uncharacterized protein n=1 Tax=Oceanobacillus neutriphilus TaxID=531815 RepID=A0ABQ2NY56_9BACI|nr:hypothetical protein [Oceanobacillus neutriphilus]GGP13530.1 hypothetical protein GCM10011346_33890 [Oceanobacillus neutriphilus]